MTEKEIRASAEAIEELLENYVVAAFFGDQRERDQSRERLDGNVEELWGHLNEVAT